MRRFTQKPGDQREPRQPVSRRVMLIASGGLMLGVAGVAGCAGDRLQAGTVDPASAPAGPASSAARRTPAPARDTPTKTITTGAKAVTPHPATARDKPDPHPATTAADGPPPPAPVYYVDDGPSPIYTPQILQILAKYRITASFSMVGENVTYYPGVAREVADAGHVIVNHTWDHADLTKLTKAQTRAEIGNATDAIHHAVGRTPTIFRAPYGAWSRTTLEYCASEKLTPLDWSVDPRDWARPGVKEIVSTIMKNTETGSIILEHDGGGNRSETVAALKIAIPRLLDRGYRFKAV